MNKLTQQQAQDLITKAWKMVSDQNLGQYRFGKILWNLVSEEVFHSLGFDKRFGSPVDRPDLFEMDFFYEPDPDVALAKFYKYFVQHSNNQLDSEQH